MFKLHECVCVFVSIQDELKAEEESKRVDKECELKRRSRRETQKEMEWEELRTNKRKQRVGGERNR